MAMRLVKLSVCIVDSKEIFLGERGTNGYPGVPGSPGPSSNEPGPPGATGATGATGKTVRLQIIKRYHRGWNLPNLRS